MSEFFDKISKLINRGEVLISDHGYEELAADNIYISDIINGIDDAEIIE